MKLYVRKIVLMVGKCGQKSPNYAHQMSTSPIPLPAIIFCVLRFRHLKSPRPHNHGIGEFLMDNL